MKRTLGATLGLLALVAIVSCVPAFAQATDPQIYVCQSCTASPGGDPNVITNTSAFDVGWDGSASSGNDLLIVLGVYDYSGGAAPMVSYGPGDASSTGPGGTAIYGWNGSSSAVTFNSSTGGTAFSAVGITNAGGSESFGNWNDGETKNGLAAASSFGLFVYELPFPAVTLPGSGSSITIDVSGAPNGTFILAYSCQVSGTTCSGGDVGQTVNTNSGLIDAPSVPEASSIVLLGTALLGIASVWKRRMNVHA